MMEGPTINPGGPTVYDRFTDVIIASMHLAIDRLYHERHPEQPHGADQIELAEENLYEACKILIEQQPVEEVSNNIKDLATEKAKYLADRLDELARDGVEHATNAGETVTSSDWPKRMTPEELLEMSDAEIEMVVHGKMPIVTDQYKEYRNIEFVDEPLAVASLADPNSTEYVDEPNDRGNREDTPPAMGPAGDGDAYYPSVEMIKERLADPAFEPDDVE